jgi:deoxycytidylate deaminase
MSITYNINSCRPSKFQNVIDILKKNALNSALYHKHSACILKNNKILTIGKNKYFKNMALDNEIIKLSIHAEIDVLYHHSTKNLKGLDILIIRISDKSYHLKNSRPCNSCIDKLKERGIRKVYYSNDKGEIVYEFIENMQKIHDSSGFLIKNKLKNI